MGQLGRTQKALQGKVKEAQHWREQAIVLAMERNILVMQPDSEQAEKIREHVRKANENHV